MIWAEETLREGKCGGMNFLPPDAAEHLFWLAALVGAGLLGGLLAGLLGVGGGIVIVPVLYHVLAGAGVADTLRMKIAVATSLFTIIATSAASMRSHGKRGAVDTSLLRLWWRPILLGVVAGTLVGGYVNGRVLTVVFATVAVLVAARMLAGTGSKALYSGFPSDGIKWATGIAVGLLSALMGIGGGTLSVPILGAFGYDIRRAVGTAAAIGFIIAIPATIGYVLAGLHAEGLPPFSFGYLNWMGALAVAPLTMVMAPVGARIAHSVDRRVLEICFAVFLSISSSRMLYDLL